MQNKQILRDQQVKILEAVDILALPVIETISPMGLNVLYESEDGHFTMTNDGATIAKEINVKDPMLNSIIEVIKEGSFRTNRVAGDGTSTTVLFSRELIRKSQQLLTDGMSAREIRNLFHKVIGKLVTRLEKGKHLIKSKDDKLNLAAISANNDKEIAEYVVETVDTAGLDGMVYIEFSGDEKTRIEKQTGFRIKDGMPYQNLYKDVAKPQVVYQDIPVLILDKKLYYTEDVETILRKGIEFGFKEMVIVAKDFIGDAPNSLITNHVKGVMAIVMAKVPDDLTQQDLAVYLGGRVVAETEGRRVDDITMEDFVFAKNVLADPQKILVTHKSASKPLKQRINHLMSELEKDSENSHLKERIASLTSGIVTIKVGGHTPIEAREKVFRYEDSINALRAAMRDGYLVGGGLALWNAFQIKDYDTEEELDVANMLSKASVLQIAKNSGLKLDLKKLSKDIGLNALTGQYENLLESGVVEPFKVAEMSLKNAASVAETITSIGSYILVDREDKDKE